MKNNLNSLYFAEHLSTQVWVGAHKIHFSIRLHTFSPPEIVKLGLQVKNLQ